MPPLFAELSRRFWPSLLPNFPAKYTESTQRTPPALANKGFFIYHPLNLPFPRLSGALPSAPLLILCGFVAAALFLSSCPLPVAPLPSIALQNL